MNAEDFCGDFKCMFRCSSDTISLKVMCNTVLEQDSNFYQARVSIGENLCMKLLLHTSGNKQCMEEIWYAKQNKPSASGVDLTDYTFKLHLLSHTLKYLLVLS